MLKRREALARRKNDIFEAVRTGDVAALKKLLWAWGIPDFADSQGATPLHHAAANGFVEGIQLLLKHKAKIGARDLTGATPLHWAARARCEASVNELVNAGADTKAEDSLGLVPLEPTPPDMPEALSRKRRKKLKVRLWASMIGLVAALLAGLAAYTVTFAIFRPADMMYSLASRGEVQALKLYISLGVDPNMETRRGKTAIEGAVAGDSVEAFELLLKAGAEYPVPGRPSWEIGGAFRFPTLLYLAADQCAPECTEYMLGRHPDMALQRNTSGGTPLHCLDSGLYSYGRIPTAEDAEKVLQLLLSAGLEVDSRDKAGRTPLHHVCMRADMVMASLLIQAGADVNARDNYGETPLMKMYMCYPHTVDPLERENRAPTVKVLLAAGADPNAADDDGVTALHKLVSNAYSEAALLVIKAGADVNARDKEGNTPLLACRYTPDADCVRLLIRAGADVNARNNEGYSALHTAVKAEDAWMLDALVSAGADLNADSYRESSLLHLAASCGCEAVVRRLLSLGLAVDARDQDGLTPLHCAALNSVVFARILVENGADVNAKGKHKRTPLQHMLKESFRVDEEMVEYLISVGTEINNADHMGNTALHIVASRDRSTVINILIKAGADMSARNAHGKTPHDLATGLGRDFSHMLWPKPSAAP